MVRSWGVQAITGNAQPLFGDVITAAFTNMFQPNGLYFVTVANTAKYQLGDRIVLGWGSGNPTNILKVDKIVSATVLGCQSEGNAPVSNWPSGTKLALDVACYGLIVQAAAANANPIYIGTDGTVTNVGGGSAFFELVNVGATTQPNSFSIFKYDGQDALRSTEITLAGTATQLFGAALFIN